MQEPDWGEIEQRMLALTLNQLKPVKSMFCGCLGGASAKRDIVHSMRYQLRHWWFHVEGGKSRVADVLRILERAEVGRTR